MYEYYVFLTFAFTHMHVQNIMLMYVIYIDTCSFWHIYAQCICMFMHIYIHIMYIHVCIHRYMYIYFYL